MDRILFSVAFLFCLTTIHANLGGRNRVVGGLTPVDVSENNQDVEDGKRELLKRLEEQNNSDPLAYSVTCTVPDLEVYKQVVAGIDYRYSWNKVCCTVQCMNDPKSNALCDKMKEGTKTEDVSCTANYFIQSWTKTKEFTGPKCS